MTKQEFIETFAHFMTESDLNLTYNFYFPELCEMDYHEIKEWLQKILFNNSITHAN